MSCFSGLGKLSRVCDWGEIMQNYEARSLFLRAHLILMIYRFAYSIAKSLLQKGTLGWRQISSMITTRDRNRNRDSSFDTLSHQLERRKSMKRLGDCGSYFEL